MTNQINNSPILSKYGPPRFGYTTLFPTLTSYTDNLQYLRLNKDNQPLLVETVSIMGNNYRGVTKDNIFWFLVEDLIPLNQSSKERLALVEKLLTSIENKHKGFIQCVDARGDREYVLMVSSEGLKDKHLLTKVNMQNTIIYRKNYRGEMKIIGHLSSEGHEHHYATILDPNESIEQQRESHRTPYCKNKLGFYVPLSQVKEELKLNDTLKKLGKGK